MRYAARRGRLGGLTSFLGSWLGASGASLPPSGRALNHMPVRTAAVHAWLNLGPVRNALEANAPYMLTPADGRSGKE